MERRGPALTEADVLRFEQQLGHTLPEDYRRFLLEVNGGRTAETHCVFTLRRGTRSDETILNTLHSLDDPDESCDLATNQKYGDDRLKDGLEIGFDDGGSPLVLPLTGPHRGEVWLLDRVDPRPTDSNARVEWFDRRDVWRIANSFGEFVDSLRSLDESAAATTSA